MDRTDSIMSVTSTSHLSIAANKRKDSENMLGSAAVITHIRNDLQRIYECTSKIGEQANPKIKTTTSLFSTSPGLAGRDARS